MPVNGKVALDNLIPEIWATDTYAELRNQLLFANIFSRQYEGAIREVGDVVRVNQIGAATGEILTDDLNQFSSEAMPVTQFSITVNKRASAAFEFTSLAQLQSLSFAAEAQEALVYAIRKKLEADLISALIPSTSSPDHDIAPATPGVLAAVDVGTIRTLLSTALVPVSNRKLLLAPSYYGDLLNETKIMSRDFTQGNSSNSGVADSFLGFEIMEHNLLGNDIGYAVHPSALQLVMQQDIRIKISDLHSQNKYGYLLSADFVYGYQLFDNKRIVKISA